MRRNSRHGTPGGLHQTDLQEPFEQDEGQEISEEGGLSAQAGEHAEGTVARAIEQQTAKLPSDVFLWTACAAMGGSCLLHLMGKEHAGLFLGQWVAPIMLFGIYNKMVKINEEVMAKHP